MSRERILVVDDEPQITRILRRNLSAHQYEVRAATDGETALETFRDFHPDLVITDLQMPELGGLALCKEIRKVSKVPIIVLSVKGEEETKVAALDAGADDYVTKPFGMDELMARVRAALRRLPNEADPIPLLERGDFAVDLETYSVRISEKEIHLTPKELDLLLFFLKNDGKVLTHRAILSAVWGPNASEQPEYLRVFVGNLRKKFDQAGPTRKYIITEPWVGYRFVADGR